MSKSRKSRPVAPRRALKIESLEQRVVFAGDALLAANDLYHAVPDQPFESSAPGVFANDTITEGTKAQLFTGPAHGLLELHEDGSFAYQPDAGFTGLDSFMYLASDGVSSSNLAAVSLRVENPQSPPVATNDAYGLSEDGGLDVSAELGLLANDTDADGDPLAASLMSGPQHGELVLNENGSFTYVPSPGFSGLDGFSYVANDATGQSEVATVTIQVAAVNDVPVANNDEFTIDEDSPLVIDLPGILANDTDADGDALTAAMVEGPQNGTVVVNPDGSFVYTPNANFTGVDGFSYVVSDGAAESDVASVTINVNAVNDAPIAADDAFVTDEDMPLAIDPLGVLANDSDVEGSPLTAALVTGPTNGAVTLNADGSFSYTPSAGFSGLDTFTYKVSDGELESGEATVTISVNAVNDAPVINNDEYTIDEDTTLTVEPTGILANDSDADGDPLTAVLVEGPANGVLTLNADGSFSYTPNANFNGVDGFRYVVSDGEFESDVGTVTINVNSVNDAPIAADDIFTFNPDAPMSVDPAGVLANDSDVEGDLLTATLVEGPTNGAVTLNPDGSFSYTPAAGFSGSDSFTYQATDGTGVSNTATVLIAINPTSVPNVRPEARNDRFTLTAGETLEVPAAGLLGNDSDPEGAAIQASVFTGPQNGTLALQEDGSFSYTPNEGFSGRDSFMYRVSDGELYSALAAVTLYVLPATPDTTPPADTEALAGTNSPADPAPNCDKPVAEDQGNCAADRFRGRLHRMHERLIDSLFAARAMRHSAHCVDSVMSSGRWWR